ncbi:hypothetical protein IFU02_007690 [Pantoea agglomerans]|uniref:hypothetical protein n=1 Tax=Enterobacter agglomerans TaxID=549 RepID=UPI0017866667|nr:hypothetical protein [Pantoea agglomerans]WVL86311.1 hypothetical protein IFU02_007690 [Pantoea agglomerans]
MEGFTQYFYSFGMGVGSAVLFGVIPALISYGLIYLWMKSITSNDIYLKSLHGTRYFHSYIMTLNTEKSIGHQGIFWFSIILPIVYFILLGSFAWSGYTFRFDAEGFKTFVSISALPLGVLSLAIPLSASVSRFHSTKQTAKQIQIVSQKNNVDLFHAHRKELFSYFEQVGEFKLHDKLTALNKPHPRLHKIFFKGDPKFGTPTADKQKFEEIDRLLESTRGMLISILDDVNPKISLGLYIQFFCRDVVLLSYELGLQEVIDLSAASPTYPMEINGKKSNLESIGETSDEAIAAFKCIENFYSNLCDFAFYKSSYFDNSEEAIRLRDSIRNKAEHNTIENLHLEFIAPVNSKEQ